MWGADGNGHAAAGTGTTRHNSHSCWSGMCGRVSLSQSFLLSTKLIHCSMLIKTCLIVCPSTWNSFVKILVLLGQNIDFFLVIQVTMFSFKVKNCQNDGFLVIQVKMFSFKWKNCQNFGFIRSKYWFFGYSGQNVQFQGKKIVKMMVFWLFRSKCSVSREKIVKILVF